MQEFGKGDCMQEVWKGDCMQVFERVTARVWEG